MSTDAGQLAAVADLLQNAADHWHVLDLRAFLGSEDHGRGFAAIQEQSILCGLHACAKQTAAVSAQQVWVHLHCGQCGADELLDRDLRWQCGLEF